MGWRDPAKTQLQGQAADPWAGAARCAACHAAPAPNNRPSVPGSPAAPGRLRAREQKPTEGLPSTRCPVPSTHQHRPPAPMGPARPLGGLWVPSELGARRLQRGLEVGEGGGSSMSVPTDAAQGGRVWGSHPGSFTQPKENSKYLPLEHTHAQFPTLVPSSQPLGQAPELPAVTAPIRQLL